MASQAGCGPASEYCYGEL